MNKEWMIKARNEIVNIKIEHRKYIETFAHCCSSIVFSEPGDIITLTGPSRAGKTSIGNEIEEYLSSNMILGEPDDKPVIRWFMRNKGRNREFNPRVFTCELLHILKHPFYGSEGAIKDSFSKLNCESDAVLDDALLEALRERKTKYLILDEMQHILHMKRTNEISAALDNWKSMAEDTGIVLIFVGAYPLLDALRQAPHLIGRNKPVHLSRYKKDNIEDVEAWFSILETYTTWLNKNKKTIDLKDYAEELLDGSLGCVGQLKKWILSALAYAHHENNQDDLTYNHFLRTKRASADIDVLASEIYNGELALDTNSGDEEMAIRPKKVLRRPFQVKTRRHKVNTGRL